MLDGLGSVFGSQLYAIDNIGMRQSRLGNSTPHVCWASANTFMGFSVNASDAVKRTVCDLADASGATDNRNRAGDLVFEQVVLSHTNATNRSDAVARLRELRWVDAGTKETVVTMAVVNVLTGELRDDDGWVFIVLV
jgi:hypothetical protein